MRNVLLGVAVFAASLTPLSAQVQPGLRAGSSRSSPTWCDCDGNPESVFTKDELLTTITLYWVTQTAASSARICYESRHAPHSSSPRYWWMMCERSSPACATAEMPAGLAVTVPAVPGRIPRARPRLEVACRETPGSRRAAVPRTTAKRPRVAVRPRRAADGQRGAVPRGV